MWLIRKRDINVSNTYKYIEIRSGHGKLKHKYLFLFPDKQIINFKHMTTNACMGEL